MPFTYIVYLAECLRVNGFNLLAKPSHPRMYGVPAIRCLAVTKLHQ